MIIGGFQKFSLLDYPGKISCIVFTQGCNWNCRYCHNKELIKFLPAIKYKNNSEDFYYYSIFKLLEKRTNRLDAVVITGGEPTEQIQLIDFIKKIKKLGLLVKLDTNGSNPDVLKEIIDAKLVDYIAMDIKAPLYKYSLIIRKRFYPDKIKKSIELIKNSGIQFEFRTTYYKKTLTENDIKMMQKLIGDDVSLKINKCVKPIKE